MPPAIRTPALAALLLVAAPGAAPAAVQTAVVTTGLQDDIVIPMFDPSWGALRRALLQVELVGGTTSHSGRHDHLETVIWSTNRSNATHFTPLNLTTSANGAHGHTIETPTYSGSGFSIGPFELNASSVGAHAHVIRITPMTPVSVGGGLYQGRASLESLPVPDHVHAYSGAEQSLTFEGSDLTRFLGESDVTIAASYYSTSFTSSHSHQVPAFSAGPFHFAERRLWDRGNHSHAFDPQFRTTVTFYYEAVATGGVVPEPFSATVWLALATIAPLARRR